MARIFPSRSCGQRTRIFVVLAALVGLVGAHTDAADPSGKQFVAPPDGFVGEMVRFEMPPDWDGKEKVLAQACRTGWAAGSCLASYTLQVTISFCESASVTMTSGDTDLFVTWDEPYPADATIYVDRSTQDRQICSSTQSGSATDACNGCNYFCAYGVNGVWRNYACVYTGPSSFCLNWEGFTCTDVDLSSMTGRRDGATMDLRWEVTQESGVAGFNLLRRLTPSEPWTRVNPALIAATSAGSYRFVDQLPAGVGDVEYRLEEVSLDGTTENLARFIDRAPQGSALPAAR